MKFDFGAWENLLRETNADSIFIVCDEETGREIDKLRRGKRLPILILSGFDKETIDHLMNCNFYLNNITIVIVIPGWETAFDKESIDLIKIFVDNLEEV